MIEQLQYILDHCFAEDPSHTVQKSNK